MNLEHAKTLLLSTHISSLRDGRRANGYFMQSGPGVGKSQSIIQYCRELARRIKVPVGLRIEMIASLTSPDMRGFMIPLRGEAGTIPNTVFTIPPWYPTPRNIYVFAPDENGEVEVYRPGEWEGEVPEVGVLFLDEWGQGEEDVRKAGAPLVLDGEVGTHRLPPGWRVVAAQNRTSDRSGVMRELMHIVNRRCLLEIEGDAGTLLRHLDDLPDEERPHPLTRAFIRKQPDIVFPHAMPDNAEPFCTARSLCMMDRDIRVLRTREDIEHNRFPVSELASELCAGFIGRHAAGQFFTHIRFANELPDLDDIISNPRTAKVPDGLDAQMICAFMLVDAVNEETAQPVVRYILRLAQRMQILAMGIMTGVEEQGGSADAAKRTQAQLRRAKAVTPLPEYSKWLMDNKDIIKASRM